MSCTSPTRDLLTFWLAGTLGPAEAELVSRHVERCAGCRAEAIDGRVLIEGLQTLHLRADEVVSAAAGDLNSPHLLVCALCRDEVALLRTVNADLTRNAGVTSWTREWSLRIAAAAVLVLAVPLVWYAGRQMIGVRPASLQITVAPQPGTPPPALPLKIAVEKASLAVLATETIALRGRPSPRRALLDDLAIALEPYRQDDFAEAATRLGGLREKRPDAPEITYYLGVCLLLLDRPADAIAPLADAARRMTPPDEARFYVSVARVNAGQTDAGLAELTRLCNSRSDAAARACEALKQASAQPRR